MAGSTNCAAHRRLFSLTPKGLFRTFNRDSSTWTGLIATSTKVHSKLNKIQLNPDTTLYPVPVVLITCRVGDKINVFSLNRIASCNAEPPMISISVRPIRASHDLIDQSDEFVVNIPWPEVEVVSDFVGTTTMSETDKWLETGLTRLPATHTHAP